MIHGHGVEEGGVMHLRHPWHGTGGKAALGWMSTSRGAGMYLKH